MADAEEWTTREAADFLGVQVHTFRGYVNAGDAPQPVGKRAIGHNNFTDLFDAAAIRAWKASRPGRGWWRRTTPTPTIQGDAR